MQDYMMASGMSPGHMARMDTDKHMKIQKPLLRGGPRIANGLPGQEEMAHAGEIHEKH